MIVRYNASSMKMQYNKFKGRFLGLHQNQMPIIKKRRFEVVYN